MSRGTYIVVAIATIFIATFINYALLSGDDDGGSRSYHGGGGSGYWGGVGGGHK